MEILCILILWWIIKAVFRHHRYKSWSNACNLSKEEMEAWEEEDDERRYREWDLEDDYYDDMERIDDDYD